MTQSEDKANGDDPLLSEQLGDGTVVRHSFRTGDTVKAEINNGQIHYNSSDYSPSGAARAALRDVKGDDYETNGWKFWSYKDSDTGQWRPIDDLRIDD